MRNFAGFLLKTKASGVLSSVSVQSQASYFVEQTSNNEALTIGEAGKSTYLILAGKCFIVG